MMLSHSGGPCDFASMMSAEEMTEVGPEDVIIGQDDVEVIDGVASPRIIRDNSSLHPRIRVFLAVYFGQRNGKSIYQLD